MRFSRRTGFLIAPVLFLLILELGCGDQYRPVINPIVGPGGQPQTAHNVYIASYNPNGYSSTNQVNVSGDSSMVVTQVGTGASYEAFLPPSNGALFVANNKSDTVTFVDAVLNNPPTTIGLLPGSHPIALASTQSGTMFVANAGTNSLCPTTGSLSAISTDTLVASSTTCVGVHPVSMAQAPNGGPVYVVNSGDNSVSVYGPGAKAVIATLTTANGLGLNPVFVVAGIDGAYVYVVAQGDGVNAGTLNIISVASDTIVGSMPLGVSPTFAYVDPIGNRLYVTNKGSNNVMVFDSSHVNPSGTPVIQLLGTAAVGTAPVSVTVLPNGTKFYTANSGSNDVTVLSASSFATLKTVAVGVNPVFVASEPTSTKIYVTNFGSYSTSIIQTVNDTVTLALPAPPQDPNCVPTTGQCALQQPFMVLSQ